ncbi:phosphatase PAP2 family protein [Herbiconiux ginsengi]|uniref:Undecaprenyl-diphosphatase n=1 Tax=Herbiconiux ginsengi TaxID=381665 RepID=A0A1H3TL55_9MICO|nr:phosphatase PAP2 family protein [Herbiconiux ginsengi]SDZ51022.1 undecaprenyl-diphosphatase [Herbiconiux ginsengi]
MPSADAASDAPTAPVPVRVARRWPVVSGAVAVLLVLGLGALVVFRERLLPFGFDTEWMEEIVEHRNPFWEVPSLVMNSLGGGVIAVFVVPIVVIVALLLFRRPWAALYFTLAIIVSAAAVQILKSAIGRPRPEEILVVSDFGSFPSGHSANAATLAVTLGIVFVRVWIWVAGSVYTLLMMASRTYLGAHWLSDTIGGLLLGAGVAVLLWAPFAAKLYDERSRAHPPIWVR